jgi:uncharacterized protein DUF3352
LRPPLALLALVAAAALAGCGEGSTDDGVVGSVPANARAYLHLDRGSEDWDEAVESLGRLPAIEALVREALSRQVEVPGDGQAGVVLMSGRKQPLVLTPDDPPAPRSLAVTPDYEQLLAGLPSQRIATLYLARPATASLRALDPTVTAAAAAADIDGDTLQIRARVRHVGEPGPCAAITGNDLIDIADPEAALYIEFPSISCALRALADRFDEVDAAVRAIGRVAKTRSGLSLQRDILPLLDHRGALIATPGDPTPALTLVVDDVDETEALDTLARLQPALITLLGSRELGQAPTFGAAEVEGVTAATAHLAPGLELSYAAWDGRLVVSTSLAGIAAARKAKGLSDNDGFEDVLGDRPDALSALVFLDLDQLLTLGEQAGLAEDPRYLALRDDLQKLRAAGAVLTREGEFTTAELTFQIP